MAFLSAHPMEHKRALEQFLQKNSFFGPTPAENVQIALIVWPARPFAEEPLAIPENAVVVRLQQFLVEGLEILVNLLDRTSAQEDRQSHLHSLELSLMQKLRPGESEDRSGGSP